MPQLAMKYRNLMSIALLGGTCGAGFGDFQEVTFDQITIRPGESTYQIFAVYQSDQTEVVSVTADVLQPIRFVATAELIQHQTIDVNDTPLGDTPIDGVVLPGDSWVTIGNPKEQSTVLTPGFLGSDGTSGVIQGSSFEQLKSGGWIHANPSQPITGDRILIAQFTLPADAAWQFEGNINSFTAGQLFRSDPFYVEFSGDCDEDGIPDFEEQDCNGDLIPDDCEINITDCNNNGIQDECDLIFGTPDCNNNQIPDECDIDVDGNGVADECEPCNEATVVPSFMEMVHEDPWVWRVYVQSPGQLLGISGDAARSAFEFAATAALWQNESVPGFLLGDTPTPGFTLTNDSWVTIEGDTTSDTSFSPNFLDGNGVDSVIQGNYFYSEDNRGWYDADPTTASMGDVLIGQFAFDTPDASFRIVGTANFICPESSNPVRLRFDLTNNSTDCDSDGLPDWYSIAFLGDADCNDNQIPDLCELEQGQTDINCDGVLDSCQCIGDVNNDGVVEFEDLLLLLAAWGTCADTCPTDLDCNNDVGFSDLLLLLGGISICPNNPG